MKLAIVGSRDFQDYDLFKVCLQDALSLWQLEPSTIISGGARGADTLAERYAKEIDAPIKNFIPLWDLYGRAAGPMRNTDIIKEATHVVAFPSIAGKGTQDSIKKANKANKPTQIYWIDNIQLCNHCRTLIQADSDDNKFYCDGCVEMFCGNHLCHICKRCDECCDCDSSS